MLNSNASNTRAERRGGEERREQVPSVSSPDAQLVVLTAVHYPTGYPPMRSRYPGDGGEDPPSYCPGGTAGSVLHLHLHLYNKGGLASPPRSPTLLPSPPSHHFSLNRRPYTTPVCRDISQRHVQL